MKPKAFKLIKLSGEKEATNYYNRIERGPIITDTAVIKGIKRKYNK